MKNQIIEKAKQSAAAKRLGVTVGRWTKAGKDRLYLNGINSAATVYIDLDQADLSKPVATIFVAGNKPRVEATVRSLVNEILAECV